MKRDTKDTVRLFKDDISVEDAAKMLKVSRQRVHNFIAKGRIVPIGRLYGRYLLSYKQVRQFGKIKRQPGRKRKEKP